MTIQEQLYAMLANATEADERVYPLVAPDNVALPYIIYHCVASRPETVLSGRTDLVNTRMQVDVYARTYAQAQSIRAAVGNLMDGWTVQNVLILAAEFFEADTRLHRVSIDYSIWHY